MNLPAGFRWTIVHRMSRRPFAPRVLLARRYDEAYIWRTFRALRAQGLNVDLIAGWFCQP